VGGAEKSAGNALESDNKKQNGAAWQQSLGRIALVNNAQEFVLVEIGTAPVPESGTPLRSYSNAEPSAELVVSSQHRRPFMIADIISGMPRVGDSVVVLGRKLPETQGAEVPSVRKVPKEDVSWEGTQPRSAVAEPRPLKPRLDAVPEFDVSAAQAAEEEIKIIHTLKHPRSSGNASSGASESSAPAKAETGVESASGDGEIIPGIQKLRKGPAK
jgi:hypothetical protein